MVRNGHRLCRSDYIISVTVASSFETHRFAMLLRMRTQTLMVRSRALRGVSNHEADGGLAFKRAKWPLFKKRKSSARSAKQQRKLPRPAYGAFRPGDLAGRIEPKIRNPLQPLLDCHRHFHAPEVGADATMNAQAERSVAVLLAVDHYLVGVGKHRGIAVGGGE